MKTLVLKFGGTSLANRKLMINVADIVAYEATQGKKIVVVVSAMAGVTNNLINMINDLVDYSSQESLSEYSSIVTTGEQVSAGIMALLLQQRNLKTRSWLSWQLPIITSGDISDGEGIEVNCEAIKNSFAEGYQVAVVAGFSGLTHDSRISSLGRGGSDTTAIAIAGSIGAQSCNIYTDVEAVFTADPRIVDKAKKISKINFEEMIAMSAAGAKVLQEKSVIIAKALNVKIHVLSSFNKSSGSIISSDVEGHKVIGIAVAQDKQNSDVSKIAVIGTNININGELVDYLYNQLKKDNIEIINKTSSTMKLEFSVKDSVKYEAANLLHKLCKLDNG